MPSALVVVAVVVIVVAVTFIVIAVVVIVAVRGETILDVTPERVSWSCFSHHANCWRTNSGSRKYR
jgi:hypothetical protein